MNKKGLGAIELIVLLSSITAALGGAYLGTGLVGTPPKDDRVVIIDASGRQQVMELQAGKSYDATITPEGKIIVREK